MLFSQPLTGFQFLILPDIAAGISSYYLWGWGANSLRELGISDATNRSSPVLINSQGIWTAVFAGKSETSHIFNISDEYYLWGENGFGKLGTGDTTNRSSPTSTLLGLSGWADISAGDGFTIGVRTDGKMYAFGYNLYGKLGDGTTTNRSSPVTVLSGGSDTWSKISCGQNSSAAIKTDGSLWTWGNGASGELGNGGGAGYSSNSPKTITGGSSGWSQVSTGFTHCIAIKTDGSLWSWGTNSYGELGDNTTTSRTSPVTVLSGGSNTWSKISCGQNFSAAIKTDGTLWTWGRDHYGQLGDGTTSRAQSKTSPGTIAGAGTNWSIIKCGNANCAAIKTDGSLWTWGWGNSGRLGHSSSASRSSPGTVTGAGNTWVNVAAGYGHVLALRQYDIPAVVTAYTAHWAWGSNAYYTFGENRTSQITSSKASPIAIPYNLPWISLSAGRIHAAGIDESGTLWSWGYNNQGQLGNGTTDFNALITSPVGGGTWQQVSCGRDWTMGLKTDGAAWTWGYNISGALGNGTAGATSGKSSPVSVLGGHTFSYINCGYRHGGGITTGGRLYLWGSNDYGELGFNPTSPSTAYSILSPISCTNFTDWTSISLGRFYSAGIANGTLYTWGNNSKGQLGDGTTTSRSSPVSISSGWSQISASEADSMAGIKTDGSLWTWGSNSKGQLGTNEVTTSSRSSPTQIASGSNWLQVSCGGDSFTQAIRTDGTLWACGYNNNGLLGDGTEGAINNKSSLVQVLGRLKNVQSLATVQDYVAVIKTDGTLWTWGSNNFGQLGTNNTTSRSSPNTTIGAGSTWATLGLFGGGITTNSAAIKTDGTLWTWGSNDYGQLGDGTVVNKSSPTSISGSTWASCYVGKNNMLGIKTDGSLWTWGAGNFGAIGDGTTNDRVTPVSIAGGGTTWSTAACGYRTSFGIKEGVLWGWGYNNYGQVGDNSNTNRSSPVSLSGGASNWALVSCGYRHTAGIKTDGTLWTWGWNANYQLGDGTATSRLTPVTVIGGGNDWSFVACGYKNSAAVKTNGSLWTWGRDDYGQLGDGDSELVDRSSPFQTALGGTDWSRVYIGKQHMVALKTDGVVWAWGRGSSGQLGTNNTSSSRFPVVVCGDPDTDWDFVTAGGIFVLATKS